MQGRFQIAGARRRRAPAEAMVPMINIVFLLLIFFLLSATIAPPDPFDVTLPGATAQDGADTSGRMVLHVSADGEMAYGDLRGDAAIAALVTQREGRPDRVMLRADEGLDGAMFAGILERLAAAGLGDVDLMVTQR